MKMNKVLSLAIAFTMLAVSFAMVGTVTGQNTSDTHNTTQITVNAVFPKLYWIGFNDTVAPFYNSLMETQQTVNNDYMFGLRYNYSEGYNNCDITVQAWYDNGNLNSDYPVESAATRNLAFTLTCDPATWNTAITYPAGDYEVSWVGPAAWTDEMDHPFDPLQNNYTVYIPIHFGPQLRAAEYDGAVVGPDYSRDKLAVLNNRFTWDFSITVSDKVQTTAENTSWGEFGIQRNVALTVSGDPSGCAPPGGSTVLAPFSNITYSSNTPYFVNVTLADNLLLDGTDPLTFIPSQNIRVQNVHTDAAQGVNSAIADPYFMGAPGTNLYVWGWNNTIDPNDDIPIMAPGNGTISAGPLASDFTFEQINPLQFAWTHLEWYVSIPSVPEGMYWTNIIVTIES